MLRTRALDGWEPTTASTSPPWRSRLQHRRVYWNAAESLLLAFQKSEWNIGRWSVLPKEGSGYRHTLEMNDNSKGLPCPSDPEARWDEEGDFDGFEWRASPAKFECVREFPHRCCRTFSLRGSPRVEALQPQSFGKFRFWRTMANGPVYKSAESEDVFLFPHPTSNAWFTGSATDIADEWTDRNGPHVRVFADAGELGRERLCPTEVRRWQISLVDISVEWTSAMGKPSLMALREGPERWPVKASCIRSQDEMRDASKASERARRRQTSDADGDDQTSRQNAAEPDDDELRNADVGALGLVIALLIGVLVIVARSCAPWARLCQRLDARARAIRSVHARSQRAHASQSCPRRQAAPGEGGAAGFACGAARGGGEAEGDARRQQEAARQQAETDRRQKDAAAAAASARRARRPRRSARRPSGHRRQPRHGARRSGPQRSICTILEQRRCAQ